MSGLAKSAFLLRKPPFCYNDKKKFDADIFCSTISNVFDRKILLAGNVCIFLVTKCAFFLYE